MNLRPLLHTEHSQDQIITGVFLPHWRKSCQYLHELSGMASVGWQGLWCWSMLIHVDFTEDGTVCTVYNICNVCTVYIVYVMYVMYVMYGNSHQHLETTAKHPAWISGISCNHFVLSAYLHQSCCLVGKDHPLRPPPMRIGKRPSTVWGGSHVGHVGHAQMLRETMRNCETSGQT